MTIGRFEAQHDLYVLLGVRPSASQAEIRRAYRSLAFRSHPDRERAGASPVVDLKLVNMAAAVLLDPARRRRYDEYRRSPGPLSEDPPPAPAEVHRPHPVAAGAGRPSEDAGGISFTPPTVGAVPAYDGWFVRLCGWAVVATLAFAVFNETWGPPRPDPYAEVRRLLRPSRVALQQASETSAADLRLQLLDRRRPRGRVSVP